MHILNAYLAREIYRPFITVLGVLVVLFASYSATQFLSDAISGLIPTGTIAELIMLKVLIALEVLIPISLYIAIVLSLSRLYSESEIVVMFALSITPAKIIRAVLGLSVLLALVVAAISMYGRPWAYQRLHELSAQADSTVNFDDMEPGTFYLDRNNRWLIFIGNRNGPDRIAGDVLIRCTVGGQEQTIHADRARQLDPPGTSLRPRVLLEDAHVYELGGDAVSDEDRVMQAGQMIFDLGVLQAPPPGYSALTADIVSLSRSDDLTDIAEYQWRLSTALSTLLLSLLAVPLSHTRPRSGKYAKMGIAIGLYSAYYLLCTTARTWVQKGDVPIQPGIWWVPALLFVVILAMILEWRPWPRLKM